MKTIVIVGGTGGLGRVIAARAVDRGKQVVVTSRDQSRATDAARELGQSVRGLAVDLSQPDTIAGALAEVPELDHLVVTAIEQQPVSMAAFDTQAAIRAVTTKLVGYAETIRVLRDRFRPGGAVVLFGGVAKDRPYPGSTMVTTFNAGVSGLVKTLAKELAPLRVNALHAGVVGDSPKWRNLPLEPLVARTPLGRLVTMAEVAHATEFLLENSGVNAHDLHVDGGVLVT